MTPVLVDTNILVYAHDRSEPVKQRRSRDVIDHLCDRPAVLLSTQVLGEFFRVVTQRLAAPIAVKDARAQAAALGRAWRVLPVTEAIVFEAMRGVDEHHLAYWDAQLWATARLNQISHVLSEDFSDGVEIEGVRFSDPLKPTYDLTRLG